MQKLLKILSILILGTLLGCSSSENQSMITKSKFGTLNGQDIFVYELSNKMGTKVKITNFGGIITSFVAKDKNGTPTDIVLGFDSLAGYLSPEYKASNPNFGGIVGRYANRIAEAKFTLEGQEYTLAKNNGPNSLHGGNEGFIMKIWEPTVVESEHQSLLELRYTSPDMEEGFPGNLRVTVTYSLSDKNELRIDYKATTDKTTVVNLTNHSYFNLNGEGNGTVLNHQAQLAAQAYTPVNENSIPTGEIKTVAGTPFDFLTVHSFGERDHLVDGKGYDHNYVLDNLDKKLVKAATVTGDLSGITLELFTTEPGIQLYLANYLDATLAGKSGQRYPAKGGFCLEPQVYPNSPNQEGFPNCSITPADTYTQTCVFQIYTQKANSHD